MRALIIVDIQNDFTSGGRLAVPDGEIIIPCVNDLQDRFDLVVATQDWHPQNHKSFASNHAGKKPFEKIILHELDQMLWPDHCVQGTDGAAFHPALHIKKIAAIFRKGMDPEIDSYSGFYDNGHKRSTGLTGYLREHNVGSVYVCGLAGDYCVFYTAMDAAKNGFKSFLIEDATRSISEDGFANAKQELKKNGGVIVNAESGIGH